MITAIKGGKIILEDSVAEGLSVYIENGKIKSVSSEELPCDAVIEANGVYIAPGFVDIHIHGAANCDFLDNTAEAYKTIARNCAIHGATSIVPTITSSTAECMTESIKAYEEAKGYEDGANMLGLHFEGPYFAVSQKGAQDERFIKAFDKEEYEAVLSSTDSVLRWTAAPELDGAKEFAEYLTKNNVLPCIGHSDADSTWALKAFKYGFTHVTHLYSGMSSVHRKNAFRYAGVVEAAYLEDDMTVEIIADGIHLPADLLKLIYKIKGANRIALITDSMRGAGMPDGPSVLGGLKDGLEVIIEDDVAKLPDRTAFAGSVAFCDRLVRNMINMAGVPIWDVMTMASYTPAKIVGCNSKGRIKEGFDADIVIFDSDINISHTIIGGKVVYEA